MIYFERLQNGKNLVIKFFSLIITFRRTNVLPMRKRRLFLLQINRYEGGRLNIYFRYFFRYAVVVDGIKFNEGKSWFLGNKDPR